MEHGVETRGAHLTVTIGDLDGGFFVANDGCGIPEDERDRVLLSGYSTAQAGTGLGLSIVKEVANAHDWSVTVDESDAGGARFEFRGADTVERPVVSGIRPDKPGERSIIQTVDKFWTVLKPSRGDCSSRAPSASQFLDQSTR